MGSATASIKVLTAFRDHLKWILNSPKFPIRNLGEFATLVSIKWCEDFEKASTEEKIEMIKEVEVLRQSAEELKFLEGSKEIEVESE